LLEPIEQPALRIMSGEATGFAPTIARAALSIAEPFYAAVAWSRNRLYDTGVLRTHRLPRPVISIGNITTGGTGKTPIVLWLADQLRAEGHRPAILLRGYRSRDGVSDEAVLLDRELNSDPSIAKILVCPGGDRYATGMATLAANPQINVFLLDDGFQHRRLARDVDIVLIDATNPFGYGHALPRGLLRESPARLRQADAVVITRSDQVEGQTLQKIRSKLLVSNLLSSTQSPDHLRDAAGAAGSLESLRGQRVFAFCGIGNPSSFQNQLAKLGAIVSGSYVFSDHHDYSPQDAATIGSAAHESGAHAIVTTEKDWVKVERLSQDLHMPIYRLILRVALSEPDRLLELVRRKCFEA
jgi:tetraacyldisaccharide 4'-kinase